jgi:hypothetical protein
MLLINCRSSSLLSYGVCREKKQTQLFFASLLLLMSNERPTDSRKRLASDVSAPFPYYISSIEVFIYIYFMK